MHFDHNSLILQRLSERCAPAQFARLRGMYATGKRAYGAHTERFAGTLPVVAPSSISSVGEARRRRDFRASEDPGERATGRTSTSAGLDPRPDKSLGEVSYGGMWVGPPGGISPNTLGGHLQSLRSPRAHEVV